MNAEEIKKAIENSRDYWERRALENKLNIIENEEDYVRRITAIYEKANKEIDDKIAAVYARYAKENKLTLDEAYQMLPKAMEKQYKRDVMDYIEKAKSGDTKWKQYLLNQSIMHKHSVLDQLRTEYRNVVYNIDMETTGGKFLEKIYANSNYHAQYSNNEENFARVDQDRIKRLLEENWSGGGNFSQTIWKNKEQLVKALDDIVITGLATGENYDKMSEKLAKRMGVATNAAKRLIMTESARMDNEGLLDYYKRTDVTHLEFIATLDMKTSDICRAMDGELIPIEEAKVGLNVPPLHPYCRSVVAPVYEDEIEDGELDREKRAYRDKDSGKTKTGNYKNYADYVGNHIGDKKQAEAIIQTKNDLSTLIRATAQITSSIGGPDKSIRDITGYEMNQEAYDFIKRRNDDDYNYYIKNGNITQEEIDNIFKELKKAIEEGTNEVAINIKMEALEKILNSNRILNGFESNNIRNMVERHRRSAEMDLFNIPEDANPNVRPVYGYLLNDEIANGMPGVKLSMYGDIRITLKNNVKKNSTITIGDSLDRRSMVFPSKLDDLKIHSCTYYDLEDFRENGLGGLYSYPEVQIFKKLDLKDIKEIVIPKQYKTDSLVKLLEKKKVKVKWK